MIEDKINRLLEIGAKATFLTNKDIEKYRDIVIGHHERLDNECVRSSSFVTGHDPQYDFAYGFDYTLANAWGHVWSNAWEAFFDTDDKKINLFRATILIERSHEDLYGRKIHFSSPTTRLLFNIIQKKFLNTDELVDWANEHKSSNDYSEFVKIYSRDDHRYKNWNYSDVEPISRTEAIKKVEKTIEDDQKRLPRRIVTDALEYIEDKNKDILKDMLEGKLGYLPYESNYPEVKYLRFGLFSDEEIFDIAKGLKNFSLEELNKILQNCSSRRLRQHIEDFIQVLENREEQ